MVYAVEINKPLKLFTTMKTAATIMFISHQTDVYRQLGVRYYIYSTVFRRLITVST